MKRTKAPYVTMLGKHLPDIKWVCPSTQVTGTTYQDLPGLSCLTRNKSVFCAYSRLRVLMTRKVGRFPERISMNKRLGFVFVALMAVPVAVLGQEKPPTSGSAASAPPVQSAPPANPITASEKGFYS